jgi:hypothetical protein
MHEVFRFDDQSLRKNEWNCRLVGKGVRLFFGVFREVGPMAWSPATQLRFDPPEDTRRLPYLAYAHLKSLRNGGDCLGIQDAEFWQRCLPGIVGVNTEVFPSAPPDRVRYCRRLADDCRGSRAELLFCDLGTGLATRKQAYRAGGRRSLVQLYWDELRVLFDECGASLAIYQHSRRQSWASVIQDYRTALEDRPFDVVQLNAGRARIVVLLKPDNAGRVAWACREVVQDFRALHVIGPEGGPLEPAAALPPPRAA